LDVAAATMTATPQRLRAVYVRRPHGVRGELRVEPLGGDASRFAPGLRLWSEADPSRSYTVVSAWPAAEGDMLLCLQEVVSRDDAESMRGVYLCVDGGERRSLGEDEWFVYELVGLRVVGEDGGELGVVSDVEEYPEHSTLVVRQAEGGERRIPMVRAHVASVDVSAGRIVVLPWAEDEA
jgi:16S rRNA processing protein RimM